MFKAFCIVVKHEIKHRKEKKRRKKNTHIYTHCEKYILKQLIVYKIKKNIVYL